MITSVVILVIGNNLARAFGLVGAMSIIRFRTAVRDVQDIVFIFFSLGVGMAAGVGLYSVAIAATLLINLAVIILTLTNFGKARKRNYLLQITYPGDPETETQIERILKKTLSENKISKSEKRWIRSSIRSLLSCFAQRREKELPVT